MVEPWIEELWPALKNYFDFPHHQELSEVLPTDRPNETFEETSDEITELSHSLNEQLHLIDAAVSCDFENSLRGSCDDSWKGQSINTPPLKLPYLKVELQKVHN